MTEKLELRDGLRDDDALIEGLYAAAFPEEDLSSLVRDLLRTNADVISLTGFSEGHLVAHVFFTICGVAERQKKIALLGPLAVMPAQQRQGYGGAIVRAGLQHVADRRVHLVCVLGDPTYYGRFGFAAERNIIPPYPLPEAWGEAWQSVALAADRPAFEGELKVPPPWQYPRLWSE